MGEKPTPSEHVRLELDMLADTADRSRAEPREDLAAEVAHNVLVVTPDPNMRIYLEDCLRRIQGVRVLDSSSIVRPDLVVYDAVNGDRGCTTHPGIPCLLVLDEHPPTGERLDITNSNVPTGFIVAPFDARTLAQAALRLLPD